MASPASDVPMNERLLAWLQEACVLAEYGLGKLPDTTYFRLQRAVEVGVTRLVLRVEFEPEPMLLVQAVTGKAEVEIFRAGFEAPTH